MNLGVEFLSAAEIEVEVDNLRNKYDLFEIPIDIEEVIEFNFNMRVVPAKGLEIDSDSAGWTSHDLSTMYIEWDVYHSNNPNFRRFTYAHELGHVVLHHKYLSSLKYSSPEEWKNIRSSISINELQWMETQSNMFAAMLLIPSSELIVSYKKELKNILQDIEEAKSKGLTRDQYEEWALAKIVRVLAKKFIVSDQCMTIRCKNLDITNLIP